MEISNLKNLRKPEVKEKYQFQVSKRYAAFEVLDDGGNQNSVWENVRDNIKVSAKTVYTHTMNGTTIKCYEENCQWY
jgi:hypothetical protein